ncbi:hypothetical protein FOZ63_021537 [Perkinsus olseni]|nr:hypothetical protein FOZ63_021537 [Perkinsus olseni]
MSAVADGVEVPSESIFRRLAKFLWLETESVDKVRKAIDAQLTADAGKLLSEGQLERIAIHEDETLAKGIGVCGAVVAIRLCEWGGVWADGVRRYYRALPAFTAFFGAYYLVRAVQGSSMLYGVMTEPNNM